MDILACNQNKGELSYQRRSLQITSTATGLIVVIGILALHLVLEIAPMFLFAALSGGGCTLLIAYISYREWIPQTILAVIFLVLLCGGLTLAGIFGMGTVSPLFAGLLGLPILGISIMGPRGGKLGCILAILAIISSHYVEALGIVNPNYDTLPRFHNIRMIIYVIFILAGYAISVGVSSSREKKENELIKLNIALAEEKKRAESALATRSSFLANMSHEIRTPINGIMGLATILISEVDDENAKGKLATIENSGAILTNLVNKILDFSKIDSGVLELESIPFSVKKVIHDVIETFNPQLQKKGIDLNLQLEEDVPEWITGDPTRLSQVLTNLIGNAVKFSNQKDISVQCAALNHAGNKVELEISVQDQGIGIPVELQSRLFKPFSQIDNSTTRQFGGTGLGLAISKSIVEQMGGTIGVESSENSGSTFKFNFPAHLAEMTLTYDAAIEPLSESIRILVAEDNEINRVVTQGFLKRLGQKADIATNGLEAIEKATVNDYDLILMDCHMPLVDGFEATQRIINLDRSSPPFIAALTASAMTEDRERCKKAGMDDFLTKPIRMGDLNSLCQKVVATRM